MWCRENLLLSCFRCSLLRPSWALLPGAQAHTPAPAQAPSRGRGQAEVQNFTPEQRRLIDAALPLQAPAQPARPRRLLVMNLQMRDGALTKGPSNFALPAQNYALEQMGQRTGAYAVTVSDDVNLFRPGTIH